MMYTINTRDHLKIFNLINLECDRLKIKTNLMKNIFPNDMILIHADDVGEIHIKTYNLGKDFLKTSNYRVRNKRIKLTSNFYFCSKIMDYPHSIDLIFYLQRVE